MSDGLDPAISRLLMDLSDRLATIESAQLEAELVEAERSSVGITERLTSSLGAKMHVVMQGGHSADGVLQDVSATWARLERAQAHHVFVAMAKIVVVKGLGRASHAHREVDIRRGWGHVLRRCGAQGVRVKITCAQREITGRVLGVGKDVVDLELDDGSRAAVVLDQIETLDTWGLAS